ncbi:MAG: iron-containing alcohol dehydrogenase [Candidatus Promineifilaceae bacterium]
MRFEFATAGRIIFGSGALKDAASLAAGFGNRAFLVADNNVGCLDVLLDQLAHAGVEAVTFFVSSEPTTSLVLDGVQKAREAGSEVVIGIGGGSVIDTGKAVAALLTNGGEPLDYMEVIGKGNSLTKPSAPYIAIPTTAGTGAEVTRNAVLKSEEHGVKVSLRSPTMLPDIAIVDPELTHSMPRSVTASTGLDALTQVMEPYVSNRANPLTDAVCREGMMRAARSLRKVYEDGSDTAAREDMALASLMGGLALANAKLGAVHGFAGVIGGMYPAPHGIICARLLPFVMETNVQALQERAAGSHYLDRYADVARILTGDPGAAAADGVYWIHDLCRRLAVPGLSEFGVRREDFPAIISKSQKASSMKGNPIELTADELVHILDQAL